MGSGARSADPVEAGKKLQQIRDRSNQAAQNIVPTQAQRTHESTEPRGWRRENCCMDHLS